ncbi:hypothetical protein CERZMDRAFT_91269 [Cercospora zeae-maydis SCOH1-5]|uniref:Uncharacterized protein n=1 Tax=Cercospora zeae-maydis SCOH1-5 TaxID=717836 RepID=A0A6A6F962_9PEZI|nr:hypothetical protein CERZMDRAFT_91269 [Cercospora zeae-maydis SCOH1-5]
MTARSDSGGLEAVAISAWTAHALAAEQELGNSHDHVVTSIGTTSSEATAAAR